MTLLLEREVQNHSSQNLHDLLQSDVVGISVRGTSKCEVGDIARA